MDKYAGMERIDTQPERWEIVVPNDNADLPSGQPKGVYFNAAGNVAMVGNDGNAVVITVAAGDEFDWRPTRIKATGTTVPAGNIIALYD